ncbi:hypothetical protein TKK_0007419 [Trichogramma kaykai]
MESAMEDLFRRLNEVAMTALNTDYDEVFDELLDNGGTLELMDIRDLEGFQEVMGAIIEIAKNAPDENDDEKFKTIKVAL